MAVIARAVSVTESRPALLIEAVASAAAATALARSEICEPDWAISSSVLVICWIAALCSLVLAACCRAEACSSEVAELSWPVGLRDRRAKCPGRPTKGVRTGTGRGSARGRGEGGEGTGRRGG